MQVQEGNRSYNSAQNRFGDDVANEVSGNDRVWHEIGLLFVDVLCQPSQRLLGLTCYVCGWAQGFKLAHSMPPHITNNANLAQWLRVLCYVIHSSGGCQFNSRSWISFFFQPLRGPTLNVESDWLVVMFTATGCHVDITTSQSDSRCA